MKDETYRNLLKRVAKDSERAAREARVRNDTDLQAALNCGGGWAASTVKGTRADGTRLCVG